MRPHFLAYACLEVPYRDPFLHLHLLFTCFNFHSYHRYLQHANSELAYRNLHLILHLAMYLHSVLQYFLVSNSGDVHRALFLFQEFYQDFHDHTTSWIQPVYFWWIRQVFWFRSGPTYSGCFPTSIFLLKASFLYTKSTLSWRTFCHPLWSNFNPCWFASIRRFFLYASHIAELWLSFASSCEVHCISTHPSPKWLVFTRRSTNFRRYCMKLGCFSCF